MSYTALAVVALIASIAFDLFATRSRMLAERAFWVSYAILLPFQLLTNWWLTHREIVVYSAKTILGPRIASAPIEDLAFGFALILITLSLWRRLESNHGNTRQR